MTDSRLAALLLVAATGCMRIYPDPELPDVTVEWQPECRDGGVTVRIEAVDDDGAVVSQDIACADGKGRIEDLARSPHRITAVLLDASGELLGRTYPEEVDLTAGHSRRTYVSSFERVYSFVHAAWTFGGGDSCESLGATIIMLDYQAGAAGESGTANGGWCADGELEFLPSVMGGIYTVRMLAVRDDGSAVAASPSREGVVVPDRGAVTELGTFELTRCDPFCDWPGSLER